MQGTGRRNAHLLAIAPNANSSIIVSTSPSIEPSKANAYTHRTRAGSHLVKNKYLEEELKKAKKNTQDVWSSIITNGGSVQHLDFLSEETKSVFKTAIEIDQMVLVEQIYRQTRIPLSRTIPKSILPLPVQRSQTYIEPTLQHGSWEQKVCTISELKHLNVQRMLQRKWQEMH